MKKKKILGFKICSFNYTLATSPLFISILEQFSLLNLLDSKTHIEMLCGIKTNSLELESLIPVWHILSF